MSLLSTEQLSAAVEEKLNLPQSIPTQERHQAALQILDSMPGLIWAARRDGSCDYFNARWLAFTGLTLADAVEGAWSTAIHVEDRQSVMDGWRGAITFGAPFEAKARVYRFDGEHRWFLIRANPLQGVSGAVDGWCGAFIELDGCQRVEEIENALSESCRTHSAAAEIAQLRIRYETLSQREREVLPLVVGGLLNKQAASLLGISEVTLQIHRRRIMQKMAAPSFAELVRMSERLGISPHPYLPRNQAARC